VAEGDDLRQFIRDIAVRHERIWREQSQILQGMVEDMARTPRGEPRPDARPIAGPRPARKWRRGGLVGCRVERPQERIRMSEQNIALIRGLYEAFGRGDVDTVLAGFDENIEWNEPEGLPYGGQYHGPQAVAENVFGPVTTDFEGFDVSPDEILGDGERVVALMTVRGTANETGKKLEMPAAHVWTVRDGKVTQFRQVADSAAMTAALAVETTV
jgi:ketosteroid isomerase-like protein